MDVCTSKQLLACSEEAELASLVSTAVELCMQAPAEEQQQQAAYLLRLITNTMVVPSSSTVLAAKKLHSLWASAALDVLPQISSLASISARFAKVAVPSGGWCSEWPLCMCCCEQGVRARGQVV
jgi:hypothetical protein